MDIAGAGINEIFAEFESHWLGREVEGEAYLPAEAAFFRDIVSGVVREQRKLDPLIDEALSKSWPLKRIEAVLRAALRAGAYELDHRRDVPARVVVSEYADVAAAFVERDETGMVKFETNGREDLNAKAGGSDNNESVIYGNAGEIYVQELWDSVLITNDSNRKLVINDIDVTSGPNDPDIDIIADTVPENETGAPANADPAQDNDPGAVEHPENTSPKTFEFDILHKFPTTDVQILNQQPGAIGDSDIVLDGDIENPIGRTYIKNDRGNLFSDNALDLDGIESTGVTPSGGHLVAVFATPGADTDYELIRTNRLQLDMPDGSIGRQLNDGPPRVPVAAEMVRFKHIDPMICPGGVVPCLFDIQVQVRASGDVVLDLTGNERSQNASEIAGSSSVSW